MLTGEGIDSCLKDEEMVKALNQMYNSLTEYMQHEWTNLTNSLYWPWYVRIRIKSRRKKFNMHLNKMNKDNAVYWVDNP
jgi:hypothetical protein